MDCIFCKFVKNEVTCAKVWENDKFIAFLDIMPINPGHLLLIPKIHNEYIFELENELYKDIFQVAKELSFPLKEATSAKRIGLVVEGFGVDHSHIHLVPLHNSHELLREGVERATEEYLREMQDKLLGVFKEKN